MKKSKRIKTRGKIRCARGHINCKGGEICDQMEKAGQPSKWHPEYNQLILNWFSKAATEPYDVEHDDHAKPYMVPSRCPTMEGFANSIEVVCDTLVEWAKEEHKKDYPGFSAAYTRAKQLQKDFMVACGMAGAGNSQFATFMLKNNHDMKDTTDLTNGGKPFEKPNIITVGEGDFVITKK